MENTTALIIITLVSNVIWFFVYKNELKNQINTYREYNSCLEKHNDCLEKYKEHLQNSEKKAVEFSESLNETVRLVTENMKFNNN